MESMTAPMRPRAAPDGDEPTIHLRCGSDIEPTLRAAGFVGGFVELSDPVWLGPLTPARDVAGRAAVIAAASGLQAEAIVPRLRAAAAAFEAAARGAMRLVLWCEHDVYDQTFLVRVLAALARAGRTRGVALIAVDHFPGVERFFGLGQLAAEALPILWATRQPVDLAQFELGRLAWQALRSRSPQGVGRIVTAGTPALPMLAGALRRHLQELPWIADGLGLGQRLALRALAAGPLSFSHLFVAAQQAADPQPFMGDLFFRGLVRQLAEAPEPAVVIEALAPGDPWPRHRVALTAIGARLLRGEVDWMRLSPPPRHVGNVPIDPAGPPWRWDPEAARPVRWRG